MRIVCLDFDNTITADGHRCRVPRGMSTLKKVGLDKPLSEFLRDVILFQGTMSTQKNILETTLKTLYPDTYRERLVAALGGRERVDRLTRMFKSIDRSRCRIVSASWYPLSKTQWKTYLDFVLNRVFGWGLDRDHIGVLAKREPDQQLSKGRWIKKRMSGWKVGYRDVWFFDDSVENIESAGAVCLTRWLIQKRLREGDMKEIELFLG